MKEPTNHKNPKKYSVTYGIIDPEKCSHSASVKMPGLKNKRECMTCHKIFEEMS